MTKAICSCALFFGLCSSLFSADPLPSECEGTTKGSSFIRWETGSATNLVFGNHPGVENKALQFPDNTFPSNGTADLQYLNAGESDAEEEKLIDFGQTSGTEDNLHNLLGNSPDTREEFVESEDFFGTPIDDQSDWDAVDPEPASSALSYAPGITNRTDLSLDLNGDGDSLADANLLNLDPNMDLPGGTTDDQAQYEVHASTNLLNW